LRRLVFDGCFSKDLYRELELLGQVIHDLDHVFNP
jgi:hypothetical protein